MANKNSTTAKIVRQMGPAWVILVCAFFMLVASVAMFATFPHNAVKVNATISKIEHYRDSDGKKKARTYVDYEFDGEDYHNIRLYESSDDFYVGKEITIYCDAKDPTNIASLTLKIVSYVLLGIGLILFGVGLAWTFKVVTKIKGREPIDNVLEDFGVESKTYQNGVSHPIEESPYRDEGASSGDSIYTYMSTSDTKSRIKEEKSALVEDPFGRDKKKNKEQ